jgi:alpha-L-arabinofuranosidase
MVIGDRVGIGIEAGRWYDIKVELSGRTIRCYLDGELIHEIQDEMDGRTFYVACSRDYDTGDVIIKAVNRSSKDQTIEIRLDGDFVASGKGYAQVLTSENLADENSFEQPEKVAPVVRELTGLGSTFSYTFDSQSVTVLRIQKQLP